MFGAGPAPRIEAESAIKDAESTIEADLHQMRTLRMAPKGRASLNP